MSSRMILSVMRVASDIKTLKWAVTAHLCQTDPQLPDDATTAEATTGARTAKAIRGTLQHRTRSIPGSHPGGANPDKFKSG